MEPASPAFVGCLLRGIERDAVERGQVLVHPGSVKPHRRFEAEVYVLTKEEGVISWRPTPCTVTSMSVLGPRPVSR